MGLQMHKEDEEINLKNISKKTIITLVSVVLIIIAILVVYYFKPNCYYIEEGNRYVEYTNFTIEIELSRIEPLLKDNEYIKIVECQPQKEDCYNIMICED